MDFAGHSRAACRVRQPARFGMYERAQCLRPFATVETFAVAAPVSWYPVRSPYCLYVTGQESDMFHFVSLVSGLLFGLGLVLSKMADPGKVIAFLDFTGCWDPSLAFVMAVRCRRGTGRFCLCPENRKNMAGRSHATAPCHTDRLAACRRQCGFRGRWVGTCRRLPGARTGLLFQPASSRQPFSSFSCLPAWDCMHWLSWD